jgi:hypothetical protein
MRIIRSFLLPLVAIAATALLLWVDQKPSDPVPASGMAEVVKGAKSGGYRLVDIDTLWDWYQNRPETTLLVDTRQEWEYRAGTIEGSLHFSMEPTRWAQWTRKGDLAELLGEDKSQTIVFY